MKTVFNLAFNTYVPLIAVITSRHTGLHRIEHREMTTAGFTHYGEKSYSSTNMTSFFLAVFEIDTSLILLRCSISRQSLFVSKRLSFWGENGYFLVDVYRTIICFGILDKLLSFKICSTYIFVGRFHVPSSLVSCTERSLNEYQYRVKPAL